MSILDAPAYSPMLIGKEEAPFDDPDYLYELKLDGVRGLAYLGGETQLRNKRHVDVSSRYPELAEICRQTPRPCVLDGEIAAIVDGKPSFAEMQRRCILSDPFKIKMAAGKRPVCFTAFDILWLDGVDVTARPLHERKALLQDAVRETPRLAVSRYIVERGKALYALTEKEQLEGVVAKRLDGIYLPGKSSRDWIKCKRYEDDDFVVLGYIRKAKGMTSLILGQYRDGVLRYKGHVTLGVSGSNYARVTKAPRTEPPFSPVPNGNEGAVWVAPSLVCTVKFMERSAHGAMRQAVFKGLRDDKLPAQCVEK